LTRDREEVRDLAQEALARAFERWGSVSRMDRPDLWVQRVVVNGARSFWGRARRSLRVVGQEAAAETALPDDELVRALQRLAPAQRRAVVLRYCLDQSVEQSAELLGVRPGTVRALSS
jgi:RNA polymerase sigma factor (sigma-70 family)